MKDYEIATIRDIRNLGSRLNSLSDYQLRELYGDWSDSMACAGWISHNKQALKCFLEWATTAPCDRIKERRIRQEKR